MGTLMQIVVGGYLKVNSKFILPGFAMGVCIWGILMIEYWKRCEKEHALFWGQLDFKDHEGDSPGFRGRLINSYVDGSDIVYSNPFWKSVRVYLSLSVILAMIFGSVMATISVYALKYYITVYVGFTNAQYVASALSGLQIAIFNVIYNAIAIILNNYENHRTETEWEDALVAKLFAFQFVNSYSSCFYIAFFAEYLDTPPGSPSGSLGQCGGPDCMDVLSLNLAIIFGVQIFNGSLLRIGPNLLLSLYKKVKFNLLSQNAEENVVISRPEVEYLLSEQDVALQSITNYMNIAIQFGYMVLFITALPIASVFVFISNLVTLQCDIWSILYVYQRPIPKPADSIGTWKSVFFLLMMTAVVTNAGIVVFTIKIFESWSLGEQMWVFIGFQWICFIIQAIVMYAIDDDPYEIDVQVKCLFSSFCVCVCV